MMMLETIETADAARDHAIAWQLWQSNRALSWGEVSEWAAHFERLAVRFGLVAEFRENGII